MVQRRTSCSRFCSCFSAGVALLCILGVLLTACSNPLTQEQGPSPTPKVSPTPTAVKLPPDSSNPQETGGCPYQPEKPKNLYLLSVPQSQLNTHQESLTLTALNPASGQKIWSKDLGSQDFFDYVVKASDGVVAYFANYKQSGTNNFSQAAAFDAATGKQLWSLPKQATFNALSVCNQTVYLAGQEFLYAYEASTGKKAWEMKYSEVTDKGQVRVSSKAAITVLPEHDDPNLCGVVSPCYSVYAFSPKSGKALWKHVYPGQGQIMQPYTVDVTEQAAYVLLSNSYEKSLQVDKLSLQDGQILWSSSVKTPTGEKVDPFEFFIDNGAIVVYSENEANHTESATALSVENGSQLWQFSSLLFAQPAHGNIYVLSASSNNDDPTCVFDSVRGQKRWCQNGAWYLFAIYGSTNLLAASGSAVYLQTTDNTVMGMLTNDGTKLWNYPSTKDKVDFTLLDLTLG
ncbi:PQQ-like beta-propeller repeat protein [Ktedonosporobacter rubrisoli]|nr:PQQ-like beta-propeller repeat protein [Ktedonosporobacter rubrisoli]